MPYFNFPFVSFADFSQVDKLRSRASASRIQAIRDIPNRSAPFLLGYIATYQTTLQARKQKQISGPKPPAKDKAEARSRAKAKAGEETEEESQSSVKRGTDQPSGAKTDMVRKGFGDLLGAPTKAPARTGKPAATKRPTTTSSEGPDPKRPRVVTTTTATAGTAPGVSTSLSLSPSEPDIQTLVGGQSSKGTTVTVAKTPAPTLVAEKWNPPLRYDGMVVRAGDSVKDAPRVAYGLMRGSLLPKDADVLPKDLEAAIGASCQMHMLVNFFTLLFLELLGLFP